MQKGSNQTIKQSVSQETNSSSCQFIHFYYSLLLHVGDGGRQLVVCCFMTILGTHWKSKELISALIVPFIICVNCWIISSYGLLLQNTALISVTKWWPPVVCYKYSVWTDCQKPTSFPASGLGKQLTDSSWKGKLREHNDWAQ